MAKNKNLSNEDLLADIRNKLGNASSLIQLVDLYFNDKNLSDEKREYVLNKIKKTIPLALESIDYVRTYSLVDDKNDGRDTSKDTHIFFQ